jgi:sulfur carrier protein ThiS
MKVSINGRPHELAAGAKLGEIVRLVRLSVQDEPMIRAVTAQTGHDQIVFVVNGRVVRPPQYDTLDVQDGDDVRWIHPASGG